MDNKFSRKIIFALSSGVILYGIAMTHYFYNIKDIGYKWSSGKLESTNGNWNRITIIPVIIFFTLIYGITEILSYYKVGNLQNTTHWDKMRYGINSTLLMVVLLISDSIATIDNSVNSKPISIFIACALFSVVSFLISLLPDPILDAEPDEITICKNMCDLPDVPDEPDVPDVHDVPEIF